MARLLLYTHIALWLDSGDERLQPTTRSLLDRCWQEGGQLLLSAVAAWEIALLVFRGRIAVDNSAAAWVESFLDRAGLAAAPLSPWAAARAYDLAGFESRDPADRLLIATAIELGCPLVTYDERMARFAAKYGRRAGFAVAR